MQKTCTEQRAIYGNEVNEMSWLCKECAALNDDVEDICVLCGAKKEKECCGGIRLELLTNGCEEDPWIVISKDTYLGRGDAYCLGKEFLKRNGYVGELHCRIACEDGDWKVYDLGSANGTGYSDIELSSKIPSNVGIRIKDGRILRIANLYFRIHITAEDAAVEECIVAERSGALDEAGDGKKRIGKWIIVCPVCGAKYFVENEDSRVKECTDALCEQYRRKEISKVRARFEEDIESCK